MPLLITNRLLTRVGTVFLRTARELAKAAYLSRQLNKYQIINGFLLRASGRISESSGQPIEKDKGSYIAAIMDFPGYLFFAGPTKISVGSVVGIAVPVGIRDDFQHPGSESSYAVTDKQSYLLLPSPSRQSAAPQQYATDWFPAIQQRAWFLGYSRLDIPTLQAFPDTINWYLDDERYFDYGCEVALTGSITSLFTSARSLKIENGGITIGEVASSYFLRNQYAIDEGDLPQEWKLYPRRLVPLNQSSGAVAVRRYPGDTLNGFAIIPASAETTLEGDDRYCHAARTFRQSQQIWGNSSTGFAYDKYGEQGLLIAVGSQNRSDYDPEAGAQVFADTERMLIVSPFDLAPNYLQPYPATIPADITSGRPELPNFGTFYYPTPVQCGEDFAVFSAYTTYRDMEDIENPATSGMAGDLWSVLTTLPNGQTISIRADWNAPNGEIPTGVAGEFMQPWIVGGAPVLTGDNKATAYCLVWEQTYLRDSSTAVRGEWAMYSTSGAAPVRLVFTGGAPLFSILLRNGPYLVTNSSYDIANPKSALYYAGENKLVTACTDYPPSPTSKSIKCAIFDVASGSLTIGGEIAVSTSQLDKCVVTVARPFMAAVAGGEETPAVLLASVTEQLVGNNGAGKTYISIDGGDSWREYVTDAGGQGGSFYVGNKLWKFDLTKGLDGRS
jgi:hypothetical protein